ncbi:MULTISPECIES: recombinase family protein [Micromonospora]|uniref:recombinase family protein n=1 Tax=Micromonospora TaxID=1873 RepID=UPI0008292AC2|nr:MULTISPECIES: recombinase family protein [Micromonospora]MCT2277883.1 recombinase family protein [Micromonospora chalcea]UFN92595.1 recombinase family protein [Micromonospora aurantiaca]SCL43096.1 Resolvase, N terminal domain [Micromonospora aurantiaca]
MQDSAKLDAPDLLGWWIRQPNRRRRPRKRRPITPHPLGIRFAFYGRMSTREFQDQLSSARWQRDFAEDVIDGRGVIVAEFFDVGHSRQLPWPRRPQAARLLAALADPDRGFDAVVIGEFERAFYGNQFRDLAPLFKLYGVELWLPELNGPVDASNDLHLSLLALLGVHSKREVQRSRFRAKAAMRAQVIEQGRHLGGRPPYGYRLVAAGPHPNRAHAKWGRVAHRLEPDPATAPHVQWMFAQRLTGRSVAGIARDLNDRHVPCPSSVDPGRNRHRSGAGWTLRTVASILANPRYTGRQVWNRQHTDRGPLDAADDLLGQSEVRRWNLMQQWVISRDLAHPPLVSEHDFVAAQQTNALPAPADGSSGRYLLTGLIRCQECGRILDSHWVNSHAAYRCRHGFRSAVPAGTTRPRIVYIHEAKAIRQLAEHLGMPHTDPHAVVDALLEHDALVSCAIGGALGIHSIPTPTPTYRPQAIPHQRRTAETPPNAIADTRGG